MSILFAGRESVYEWKAMNKSRERLKWDVRKWKSKIERENSERRTRMERRRRRWR